MALSADKARIYTNDPDQVERALPVQASTTIYAGGALTIDTGGEVGPLSTSEASFVGFARKGANNSGGSAGDINAAVITKGCIELTITGLDDNNDIGDIVYASDDNTFTLTSTGNMAIGRVAQIVNLTDNKAMVKFHGSTERDAVLA